MAESLLSNIEIPSVISKDECLYCYESIYNEPNVEIPAHSLNLCLSCFQAVCHRHTPLHAEVTKQSGNFFHPNYLNISKVRKVEDDHTKNNDNSNKKIKLHIIEKSEDEMYDTFWSLIKYDPSSSASEKVLTNKDSNIPSLTAEKINQILNSKSREMVDQTNSWELSISSCTHSRNFEGPKEQVAEIDQRCTDCDLGQNLWLCLHCGNIGCGREQVGIDGHSHALKHFENNPEHSLAVKLGSLSDSSSDVYCYACNDEVKFDNQKLFVETLKKFGIDLNSRLANEKTLVELQVEQNMSWDFQMIDSQGKDLAKLPPGQDYGCGLINLGNSCYMNSVLQCLLNGAVKNYSWDILGHDFQLDVVYPGTNLRSQLIKLNNALKLEPELYANGIRPATFKKCISQSNEEFSSGRQQDALEYLTFLVENLDKKLFSKNDSNPNDLLKFIMEDRLQCNKCGKVNYTSQPNEAIQIPLLETDISQNILDRLRDYFQGEQLEFKCSNCKEMVIANKRPGFKTFPDTLVINPIRIKLQNWVPVKTSNELSLPGLENASDLLDLSQYKSNGFNPETETLLTDDEEDDVFTPNATCVSRLSDMGFGSNAIIRALFTTGKLETEPAMNWLFQHIDDPDLNEPFTPPKSDSKNSEKEVDPEAIKNMAAMGLDLKLCKKALILNNGDVNRSVEWVFNNMDDDGELPKQPTESKDEAAASSYGHLDPAQYELTGVVCHKGNSVHSGHYVAFIRKTVNDEKKWVLYNDEKIVLAVTENFDEIKKNGYFYFYSRV